MYTPVNNPVDNVHKLKSYTPPRLHTWLNTAIDTLILMSRPNYNQQHEDQGQTLIFIPPSVSKPD
ncbi:hypothetical protein ASY01nite_22910 [Acetobacter syzygii]|nr:hypothetical protein Absy_057_001 [Acetobacter syzygii]GBR65517.1 hypothetical protein AA0483_1887 [Acetobacter syzygii NRIC 0483]GEL57225.1 hypothetical protein ASY01nite_22910 [Acetobacter syzygii]